MSIEMIEAVGREYYDTFFRQCARLLKPNQRYIFPGSTIPSVTALLDSATRASDLRLFHLEGIGPHYATTLARWRQNFLANLDRVRRLGLQRRIHPYVGVLPLLL